MPTKCNVLSFLLESSYSQIRLPCFPDTKVRGRFHEKYQLDRSDNRSASHTCLQTWTCLFCSCCSWGSKTCDQ